MTRSLTKSKESGWGEEAEALWTVAAYLVTATEPLIP